MALGVPLKSQRCIILGEKRSRPRLVHVCILEASRCHCQFGVTDRTKSNQSHTVRDITRGIWGILIRARSYEAGHSRGRIRHESLHFVTQPLFGQQYRFCLKSLTKRRPSLWHVRHNFPGESTQTVAVHRVFIQYSPFSYLMSGRWNVLFADTSINRKWAETPSHFLIKCCF